MQAQIQHLNCPYCNDGTTHLVPKVTGVHQLSCDKCKKKFAVSVEIQVIISRPKKTQEELGEDLCDTYCALSANERGVRNFGDGPIYCSDSPECSRAYDSYMNDPEEE